MYTLSDETRMRANTRDTSPFPGAPTAAANRRRNDKFGADADARRQGNDTFTPAAGGAWTPMGDARRQANDTFTPGGGINTRANTMTAATAAQTAAVAAAAASSRKKKAATAADENPFRLPPLTGAERAYMARRAKESSIALVDHAHTLDGPVEWQYTGKFRGIQMYRGEGAASEADGMEYLCGVTTMAGSLAEVSAYFDQSTTERMRAKKADDVLDCAVLYAIEEGSSKNPFYRVAVKYTSFEGPSTFSRARDYVYLECQDTFRHASGRRGWVLSMHSIKLPNCPEMEGTVRGSMYHSGYVFVEAERPGYMDVMHSLQINFKATKRLPSFMLNSALKRRITSVIKISREIQMARMGQHALLRKQDLMPKNSRSLCANCARKFTLFIRKTRCRMCGQVVCQSCAPQVDWAAADGDKKKTRICVKCYRTGGSLLPQSQSTTSKNSAEYSDDEDLAEHEHEDAAHMTHSHDDDDEDAAGDDGLEEQTEESVFAQSRFTRTADSMFSFSSEFHIHDLGASKAAAAGGGGGGRSRDLLEDTTFEADMSFSSNFYDTKVHLTPEDTDEELDKRARRYDPNFRSTSIAEQHHDASSSWGYDVPPPPPPPVPTLPSHLSADSLKEHNKRFAGAKKQYQAPPPPPFPAPMAQQGSGKLVSIKDIRSNYMKGTEKGELPMPPPPPRDSLASPAPPAYSAHYEDDYISRPPSAILSRVRANRSRTIQFAPEGNYRSPEMMQTIQDEHNKRMAELSASTELYNSSSRVAEPETNAVDDEPFTLEHLEVPAAATVDKQEPPVFASIDDYYDNERGPPQTPKETSVAAWEAEQDAEAFYAPVSALELSQVRANRSHTIEFIPQFMQPEGTAEEDEQEGEELSSDDDHGPEIPVELLQAKVEAHTPPRHSAEPVVGHQESARRSAETAARHSTPRHSSESKTRYSSESKTRHDGLRVSTEEEPMRVTEQYANLQIPSGEVIEMPPSPVAQAPEIAAGEPTLRFSQTMIPILDLSTQERGSDAQSESAFSMIAEPRESRKFSDIPILGRSTAGSVRESDLDLELLNRPTAVIMEQINANRARAGQFEADEGEYDRSTEIMQDIEAEHKRRMAELNRIALDYTGNRISRLNLVDEDRESMDTVDYERLSGSYRKSSLQQQLGSLEEDYEVRASEALPQFLEGGSSSARASAARVSTSKGLTQELRMSSLEFTPEEDEPQRQSSRAEPKQQAAPSRFTGLEFSLDLLEPRATTDEKAASPRVSIASTAFDDELMSRSTEMIMDQVRSNRARVPKDLGFSESQFRSTAIMKDKELEHKKRMAELAQIARDNRVSTFEARESEDGLAPADRSLLRQVNTAHIDSEWRATVVMDQVHSSHEAKMEELRKKVRDLDDQCRASMASIFSADELDFADLDAEVEAHVAAEPAPAPAPEPLPKYKHREVPPAPSQSANGGGAATAGKGDENSSRIANLYSVKNLRPVAARRNPVVMHERVSSATLYQQIAQLTELQSQLAAAKDTKDEEAFKKRIKDQYKLLRTLKLRGY